MAKSEEHEHDWWYGNNGGRKCFDCGAQETYASITGDRDRLAARVRELESVLRRLLAFTRLIGVDTVKWGGSIMRLHDAVSEAREALATADGSKSE